MAYQISKIVFWPLLRLFIKKIKGTENLPDKPFITIANHQSYIDGIILLFMTAWYKDRQLCILATKEEFKGPLWSSLFEYYGAIRVNGSVKKAVKALKQGKCIGLFPEGARTKTGKTQKIQHTGAGAMALLTKAPIVPIGLYTYKFWNRHMLLPNFKQNIGITIGKPIKFKTKPTEKEIEKTTKTIWNEVKKLARTSHT